MGRDRRINSEKDYELLAPANYEGKSVLEPGSGFGCNLFSLSRVKGRFVGLEPVELYRQMTSILAAREGLPEPEVVGGSCEALPFGDAEFDFVLCYGSHQYMKIPIALGEIARVLKPGGQLRILGETLGGYVLRAARELVTSPRLASHYGLTLANTLAFELTRSRLWTPRGDAPTTAPVYPSRGSMHRWMREQGLRPRLDLMRRFADKDCLIADKEA
jgi:SAM-dependent methyltransferase